MSTITACIIAVTATLAFVNGWRISELREDIQKVEAQAEYFHRLSQRQYRQLKELLTEGYDDIARVYDERDE